MAYGGSGRGLRALRGSAAAAIAVLIASTAHTLSGGDAPPFWLTFAVTILAAPVCVALVGSHTRRTHALPRLGLAVAVAQLALHTAFAAVGGQGPAGARAGHHHAIDLSALVTGGEPGATVTATMLAGHVVAALFTFVALAWGERLAAVIARGVRRLLSRTAPTHRARSATVPPTGHRAPHLTSRLVHCARRRGPPLRHALPRIA